MDDDGDHSISFKMVIAIHLADLKLNCPFLNVKVLTLIVTGGLKGMFVFLDGGGTYERCRGKVKWNDGRLA